MYLAIVSVEFSDYFVYPIIILELTHIETYKPRKLASTNLSIICETADQEFQQ